jgi:biotin/methionine sulfoxide reductase
VHIVGADAQARFGRFPSLSHWGAYTAVVEEGRVVRCEPFELDPQPSPMLAAIPEMVHSPLRIARPSVRAGWLKRRERSDTAARGRESFVEVSWDTALTLVADELARVRRLKGDAAIFGGSYGWSSAGRFHHARTLVRRFLFAGGGCTDQVGNYSWGSAQFLLPHVIGTYAPLMARQTDWRSVVHHTRRVIAFGGLALKNGQISAGGTGEHTMEKWLRAAKGAGVEFVVISPTRNDAPALVDARWISIRPNTDTALMLAMAHTLVVEGRHDIQFLEEYCTGFEPFRRYLLGEPDGTPKSVKWAAAITGVEPEAIRELARSAASSRTLITCAWSLQRAHHGEQPYWAAIALAAMLGQIGLPGGGFAFGHGSINGVGNPRVDLPSPEMSSGRNSVDRTIPVARVADMLLNPGAEFEFNGKRDTYPDIRLVYWAGGNPFHHHQDLNRLRAAWQKPDTIVVHEPWWTPAARHADIVLPATTTLERNDIGGSGRDRFVLAMHRAVAPFGSSRNDWDIFSELAARGGYAEGFTENRSEMQWIEEIYTRFRNAARSRNVVLPEFAEFWSRGHVEVPAPEAEYVLFEEFRKDPSAHPLKTPSGRIELFSEVIEGYGYEECPPHPSWLPPVEWLGADKAARWPLHLVTMQPANRLHSQMDPSAHSKAAKVSGREKITLNSADAQKRGVRSGDIVRVYNERGACLAGAEVSSDVRPGVALMATGSWFDPADENLERHGNANVLTLDIGTSRLTQGSSALSVLVDVERWDRPVPELAVFEPPAFEQAPISSG